MATFSPEQEGLIVNEITKQIAKALEPQGDIREALQPIQAAIDAVNAKQANNAETLEKALDAVKVEASTRIEEMRGTGEKYDTQMQENLRKMEEAVRSYAADTERVMAELKATALTGGMHIAEMEDKHQASEAANVAWKAEAEKYINEGRHSSTAQYELQCKQLDVWI